jgi:hypothetical protein
MTQLFMDGPLESIAAALTVPERVLLFCLASGTDWQRPA